ncbi:MAG: AmmeMemoRadiSam system radical SAM enzyme [Acidobacteriota bacterium]
MTTRRRFLSTAVRLAPCAPVFASGAGTALASWVHTQDLGRTAPTARFWVPAKSAAADCGACHLSPETLDARHTHARGAVACQLCAQRCLIRRGDRGRCRARMNVDGSLRSLVYGRPLAVHVDPIEKKPFFHFLPGRTAYSLGTAGCPLSCRFCQNWEISQARPEDFDVAEVTPAQVVAAAAAQQSPVVAFTYNEPTVFTEYLLDIAGLARKRGLRSVLVSCGFMNEAPLAEMCRALDAIKIDLKGFSDDFYRAVSRAALAPVLRSIKQVHRSGTHLELVNLVVPTLNDADASLRDLATWVADELGPDVPVHFTRFHPDYQMLNLPPTPVATLERARALAMDRGLHYVYVGNVPGHAGNHTYCPSCRKLIVRRDSFFVTDNQIRRGACGFCGTKIAGVWDSDRRQKTEERRRETGDSRQ